MRSRLTPRQTMGLTFLLTCVSVLLIGCGSTRVVFVNSQDKNDLIRVGPGVEGKAYVWDGTDWILSKNKIEYPEGAFVGFLDGDQEGTTEP